MALLIDLAGDPVLDRSALFVGGNRIELRRRWSEGPTACIIGHNPAEAGASKDDRTSTWWINWCRQAGFGGYVALNFYPWVSAIPSACYGRPDPVADLTFQEAYNLPAIRAACEGADQVFGCWGAIARDPEWVGRVTSSISAAIWCWGMNADGSPRHPMSRGRNRMAPDQPAILWQAPF